MYPHVSFLFLHWDSVSIGTFELCFFWLFTVSWKLLHIIEIFIFFNSVQYSLVWMCHSLFSHLPICRHLGAFPPILYVYEECSSVSVVLYCWGCIPRMYSWKWTAGFKSECVCDFVRRYPSSLQNECTSLYSQQQCTWVPVSSHPQ